MPYCDNKGFSLIEVILIIVIAAVAIPLLLMLLGQEAAQSVRPELTVTATNLAKGVMEEIRSKRWDETPSTPSNLGIDVGEIAGNTSTYDDIDDYTAGVPSVVMNEVAFNYTVEVCYVQPSAPDNVSPCLTAQADATDYKRTKVTVTNQTLGSVDVVTLMTNYSP